MSGNEDDKGDINKVYPLDLVSKLNVKPVTEISKGTPLLMTNQPLRRVLTQTVSGSASSSAAVNIVPQSMIKQSFMNQTQSQNTNLAVARPAQITLATSVVQSQPSGATYHVPRGPAAVANLATPRSAVATPIRTPGGIVANSTGQQAGSGFVTTVRQVTPSRAPSPATTWLTSNMQIQNQQIVKNVGNSVVTTSATSPQLSTNLQRISTVVGSNVSRAPIIARTTQTTTNLNVTPLTSVAQPRQAMLHSTTIIGQPNQQQIHAFKPAGNLQTLGNTVTLAQVLPTRPQTLVYSTGNTQSQQQHHFTARSQIGIANNQRQITNTTRLPNQVIGTRLAVPVSASQGASARLTVTPGPTTIYTTGPRLSAHSQNIIAGSSGGSRINVPNIQQQSSNVSRSTGGGTLLTTTQARITVPSAPQQQSAVVIGTQAGGRLAASVVSLHPVVVANSSQATRQVSQQGSKIIAQSNQGAAIQLAQVPTVSKLPVAPGQQSVTVPTASTTRTINVTPTAIVSQRPVPSVTSVPQGIPIPITKVFPQGNNTPIIRRTTSPVPSNSNQSEAQRTSAVTTYYYGAGSAFSVSGNNLVGDAATSRPYAQSSASSFANQVHGIMSGQSLQFSPVMVVEQKRTTCSQFLETATTSNSSNNNINNSPIQNQSEHMNPLPSIGKVTSSPRPSILRKRDNDGSALKAAKNLAPLLSNIGGPISPPSRPLSRDNNGNSSGGSTTISATSSPGLGEIGGDDSLPLPPVVAPPAPAQVVLKLEEASRQQQEEDNRPQEMSPRKKPRKQQLIGNDEPKFNIDDMQFLSENKVKKDIERGEQQIPIQVTRPLISNEMTVKKPQTASLLNSYRQSWKSTHNHYLRYTDVKPKDERRPSIIDLANQTQVMQKINGWKIHHLSTQMEDLCDLETQVYDKLSTMLKLIETKESCGYDKEFNRINELIKGNMQRSKIINDSTSEAKTQVMKIFDHKEHVADIIQRCASKRNFKKREK